MLIHITKGGSKMKNLLILLMCLSLVLVTGCGNGDETSPDEMNNVSKSESQESQSSDKENVDSKDDMAESDESSDLNIALITDVIGTEQFLLQAYNKVEQMAGEYGFSWTSIECTDNSQWAENTRAASNEGYDLIIGIGWPAAEPFSEIATDYPEIKYAVIDGYASNEDVMSIGFNEAEGAYVMGVLIGTVFPDEELYGYISSFQTQATYKYRYGFSEGVKSVNPEAEFMYNYTNSYSDTTLAYEYAKQQHAAGANVIVGGISASSNEGIYQAALELTNDGENIYTTGLSIDQTTSENPSIVTGLLKNTGVTTEKVILDYMEGLLIGQSMTLGLKEGAFGVVHVTTDSSNFVNAIVTDDAIYLAKEVASKIINGDLVITAPLESEE